MTAEGFNPAFLRVSLTSCRGREARRFGVKFKTACARALPCHVWSAMTDKTPEADLPKETAAAAPVDPLSDVVKRTLLELADWQEETRRITERVRTSNIKPPPEPPEIIP